MLCLVWRISLDGVTAELNLARRGILSNQDPSQCVFCGVMDESTNHLFLPCSKSYCV
ncbi:putative reverse transcriptase zinc-binding domain-containing protein [Lupinus albus]|uniref:Putative reverse transcriptase zinc-binding domain-containing protein n=1 Tax=Lupinus albus TaxID=3870 RepID=A0A6A4PC00_LUPAL|nr:putative reverse transcriptase zinc-binding domain-containing protein [Lupinus albus]